MGKSTPVLIGFLASLLGIGGLADKVIGVIKKIRELMVKANTKFWKFIKAKAGKLLSKLGIRKEGRNKEGVSDKHIKNMDSEIAPEPFTMNGERHSLTFEKGEIYMESEKGILTNKLNKFKNYVGKKPDADEFEGKGPEILSGIDELQTRNRNVKRELTNANKLVDINPYKAEKTKRAQAKLIV